MSLRVLAPVSGSRTCLLRCLVRPSFRPNKHQQQVFFHYHHSARTPTTRSSSSSSSNNNNNSSSSSSNMETIKSTIAENFGGPAHKAASAEQQFDIDADVPSLSSKVAVITGGSEGIGYAASFVMLRAGLAKLFVLSVDKAVMDGALADISSKLGKEYADRVVWIQCDLADWLAVTKAAEQIRKETDRLDILILNAARGIMTYQLTDYGVERHMAVNHFAHVILCSHLMPLLKRTAEEQKASGPVRISIQASNAHQAAPKDVKFASLDELNTDLGPQGQYGRSKLASILYARFLARHLPKDILVNSTHPGFVETKMSVEDIHEPYPILGYGMSVAMAPFKKDQWMGSASTLYCATKTKAMGQYICPPAIPEPGTDLAQDENLQDNLMRLTKEVVKEKFGKESVDKGCPLEFY